MCWVDEALGRSTGAKTMGLEHLPFDAQAPDAVKAWRAGICRLFHCLFLQVACPDNGQNMKLDGRLL